MIIKTIHFLFLSLLLTGCGTYQVYAGGKRPASEVATIINKTSFAAPTNPECYIYRIDGQEVTLDYDALELLPGDHDALFLMYQLNFDAAPIRKTIHLEAGKTYACRAQFKNMAYKESKLPLIGKVRSFESGQWGLELYEVDAPQG
ncbi:hypothetical protein [Microbulbifer sp. SAOS-129_SWC]|uniref:hypothetical protein n=1 Tax=Microbulbifer sp. SAOS-129_SWC TaxID=3145235 RepID=UPI0032164E53